MLWNTCVEYGDDLLASLQANVGSSVHTAKNELLSFSLHVQNFYW